MPGLVTLSTDFGTRDPYVAAVKGVLLASCSDLAIVDLTHELAPYDVVGGALFLAAAVPYYPPGTVHLAVVDPGVGTDRRPLAVRVAGAQTLVCPDNGLITLLVEAHPIEAARVISDPGFAREPASPTFAARDLFAVAAARLACGADLAEVGPPAGELVTLDLPTARRDAAGLVHGEVIHIDRFGNATTSVPLALLRPPGARDADVGIEVRVRGQVLSGLHRTYADVAPGAPLALIGSTQRLELAVRLGSAAAELGLRPGDAVEVRPHPEQRSATSGAVNGG